MTPEPHPLDEIYEKFKHLDQCLSDTEWCEAGEGGAIYGIAGELWRAIKTEREHTSNASPTSAEQVLDILVYRVSKYVDKRFTTGNVGIMIAEIRQKLETEKGREELLEELRAQHGREPE